MINVIGLGYIGLPTALMMASSGLAVVGTDHSQNKVDLLNNGETTFKEPGLDELFRAAVKGGIKFTTEYQRADVYIVSVQTPYDELTKKVDMSYVNAAIGNVLDTAPGGAIIVIESTISPGSIDHSVRPCIQARGFKTGSDVHLVHAPERIIPGNMVCELVHNNRTIGADDREIGERVANLYASFCRGQIVVTDIKTAEMTKVIENSFRCVNIAFANEVAKICRSNHLDVYEVIRISNLHPRVNILNPGPGVGGHCIPVDPWFLTGEYPFLTPVIGASLKVNASMPEYVLERMAEIMEAQGITDPGRVGLYGLTFKENVDDCRNSPTLQLLALQKNHAAQLMKVYDPFVGRDIVPNQFHDLDAFLKDVDLVVVMVRHSEIIHSQEKLLGKSVLDCHNVIQLPGVYHL